MAGKVDAGYFGPGSITWRVHADPMMLVGGLRALYLQALYPPAMAAVATHSNFRHEPWRRLLRTAGYIGTTTYGTTADANAAAAWVRSLHAAVPGAREPHRLLWIHCCEVDSFLSTTRRAGLSLDDRDADRYVEEQVRSAMLVGLRKNTVPRDTRGLAHYFERMRPSLSLTPQAEDAVRYLLLPPMPNWIRLLTPARPGWAALAILAFGLLPAWARRLYGMPGFAGGNVAATAAARAMRTSLLLVPPSVRSGRYARAAIRRVVAAQARAA
jgi:uncharacterized protein (DUF2236 family)